MSNLQGKRCKFIAQHQLASVYPWPVFILISSKGILDTLLIINEVLFTPAVKKEKKNEK